MKIDHIRFYVEDASRVRQWFTQQLGFESVARGDDPQRTEIVQSGQVFFVLCSPVSQGSPAAQFLQRHPPGVAEVAFVVQDIQATIDRALAQGATLLQPIQTEQQPAGQLRWATIAAWGDVTHTFLQRSGQTTLLPLSVAPAANCFPVPQPGLFTAIDHLVLNVEQGCLDAAVTWYTDVLGFQPQQQFEIQTDYSALCSRVMRHPDGVQLPINEPASPNSQIQEFLQANRGAGIQHIALETADLVRTIAQLRCQKLALLHVPPSYYQQLRQRSGLPLPESALEAIAAEEILVDWQQDGTQGVLLQTFTQPIFQQPTFFFELIERRASLNDRSQRAQGFGEGNFRALFEAIEREQIKRGSLALEADSG